MSASCFNMCYWTLRNGQNILFFPQSYVVSLCHTFWHWCKVTVSHLVNPGSKWSSLWLGFTRSLTISHSHFTHRTNLRLDCCIAHMLVCTCEQTPAVRYHASATSLHQSLAPCWCIWEYLSGSLFIIFNGKHLSKCWWCALSASVLSKREDHITVKVTPFNLLAMHEWLQYISIVLFYYDDNEIHVENAGDYYVIYRNHSFLGFRFYLEAMRPNLVYVDYQD